MWTKRVFMCRDGWVEYMCTSLNGISSVISGTVNYSTQLLVNWLRPISSCLWQRPGGMVKGVGRLRMSITGSTWAFPHFATRHMYFVFLVEPDNNKVNFWSDPSFIFWGIRRADAPAGVQDWIRGRVTHIKEQAMVLVSKIPFSMSSNYLLCTIRGLCVCHSSCFFILFFPLPLWFV